jgi:hypothetical protein
MTEEMFWPEVIREAPIPEGFTISQAIVRVKVNMGKLKPAVHEIVMDCWYVHELLVQKRGEPGETWGGFCKEVGYDQGTPHEWFKKYGLPVTRIHGRLPDSGKPESPKPTKKHTNPEVKMTLTKMTQEIESGRVSDEDIRHVSVAIAKAVESGKANSRVAAPAAIAYKKKTTDTKKKEDFKEAVEEAMGGPKTRIRNLYDAMTRLDDEFIYVAQGTVPMEKGDEVWIQAIAMKGPQYIWNFHKLGVDLMKVYDTVINPKKKIGDVSEPDYDPANLPG